MPGAPVANRRTSGAVRVDHVDPVVDEVGEEVVARVLGRELVRRRVVERAAGDREPLERAAAVAVGVERPREVRERRLVEVALGARPAEVPPGPADVDLLPGVLADVVDVHHARCRAGT